MKTRFLTAITIFLCALIPLNAHAQLKIVSTTSQIGDLVKNISGEYNKIDILMGTGVDPHLYQPTRGDISKLIQADIIFYNGKNLEGRMVELLEKLAKRKTVIAIADHIDQTTLISKLGKTEVDPHIWMDVNHWINAAATITKTLESHDCKNGVVYIKNQNTLLIELNKLDTYAQTMFDTIPDNQKILITAHDAFGYLQKAYGIEVVGIQGISTESEAGIKRIQELVEFIITRKVPAIFVESSVGDHNIKAIIEGAQARGFDLKIGGELFSDAMGQANTPEGTYIGMMKHNIKTISTALGGNVQ